MNRTRIVALFFAMAFFATLTVTSARAEDIYVINKTATPVWVTLYADVGAFGWAQHKLSRAGLAWYRHPWVYNRNGKDPNGPWKVRFEVTSPSGKRYDLFTTTWFDGNQRRFNATGDPNTYLYVCEENGVFHWSHNPNCSGQDNTGGI